MYANNFKNFFNLNNFKIVKYYPYTSRVSFPILQSRSIFSTRKENEQDIWMNKLWIDIELYLMDTYKINPDNKVVVKLQRNSNDIFWNEPGEIYIGCYDGQVSIGIGVYQPEKYTNKYNIEFK